MAVSIQKFPVSEFSTIFCQRIIVNPPTTSYKWDPTRRNENIAILGSSDTAKAVEVKGDWGILGSAPFIVGTTEGRWVYYMYVRGSMLVGMASASQNLSTYEGTALTQLVNGAEGDLVRFALSAAGILTITHEYGKGGVVSTNTYDLIDAGYGGQTLYYWLSTTDGYTMSVKVAEDVYFSISTDADGKSRMHASLNDIVDFSFADIAANDPDAPPIGGGDSIVNLVSGKQAKVYADGRVAIEGGLALQLDTTPLGLARLLTAADYAVNVQDPSSGPVTLPAIGDVAAGQQYFIARSFDWELGETWQAPVLSVNADGTDTIGGDVSGTIGLRPFSSVRLTSDGVSDWIVG